MVISFISRAFVVVKLKVFKVLGIDALLGGSGYLLP